MITKQLLEQIEGEASLYHETTDGKVDFTTIAFENFRGMEAILQGKNALDALVITPRVCGICGHAHLMASVRAIEDAYANAKHPVVLSQKAKDIREITLSLEIIQNHFKWIYFTLIPELQKLSKLQTTSKPLKGAYAASLSSKAIATFSGQWPHSSYMLPGGITCDPTHMEKLQALSHLQKLIAFFQTEFLGTSLEDFLSLSSCKEFEGLGSDVEMIEQALLDVGMHTKGFAHDRFVILGEHSFTKVSKLKQTRTLSADVKYVTTLQAYTPHQTSHALNALYKDDYYEVGPLARAMSTNVAIIKNMHRRFKDSAYTRVFARIFELAQLLKTTSKSIESLDISETSYTKPLDISKITAKGVGVVEAPRGPLVHTISIKNGKIEEYKIITPTQWNICSSTKEKPSPSQKAMIGVSQDEANFIFRTFDVCSVCTTH